MDPADWQRALRRQFGPEQSFELRALAVVDSVLGDWSVTNPARGTTYRISVRGLAAGDNFCACADYATNGLGTCKHIEFALATLRKRRGAKAAFVHGWQPGFSEVWLRHAGDGSGERSLRWRAAAGCPPALDQLARHGFTGPQASWPADRLLHFDTFAHQALRLATTAGHELRIHEDALAFVARARDAHRRTRMLMDAYPKGVKDKGLVKLLATRLYPYQVEGALFAARSGRVLIGDDMGLGKTVQTIAAAELMARHFGVQRVLVVCPTSLKHQWQGEIARFARREAQVLQGLRAARQPQWRESAFCKIVNYETLVRDLDLALEWAPDLLIVDEAQRVKNWNTQAARAVKHIAAPERCANVVVLTGTPLENRLEELVSIVQVADQHLLGPTWRVLHEHQQTDESGRVTGYRGLDRLGRKLAPVLLRRRKAEVLDQLPERVDKTLFVPLTPEQRAHHDENGLVVSRIVQRWRKTGYLSDTDQRRLQCALQCMRMACNSTWLLDHETDHGTKADELIAVLEEVFADPEAKAVVFSQWLGTHEVLIKHLAAHPEAANWGHVFFHGSVPSEQRGALVRRFHDDAGCRLFLSTDAGGTGLNLQHAAAVVVNMDLPWNPAVLEQRIGRVHRMGQRRGVQVVNFVAEASIEESMLSVLSFKKSLAEGVLDGGEAEVFLQGSRLARFMDSVDRATASVGTGARRQDAATATAAETAPADGEEQKAATASPAEDDETAAPPAASPAGPQPSADPWAPLLHAGLQFLQALDSQPAGAAQPAAARVHTDAATGERYLRLPLPEPAALRRLADKLAALLETR